MSETELRAFAEALQRDYAELHQQYQALQDVCDRYRDRFEQAPTGYLILDGDGRIEALNERAAELLGASAQALEGTLLAERLAPDAREDWLACYRAFSPAMSRCSVTLRLQHPAATERIVLAEAVPEPPPRAGSAHRYRLGLLEVTEWHRALQQRDHLLEILDASPNYIGMADPEGRLIYRNPAFKRAAGLESGNLPEWLDGDYPAWAARKVREAGLPEAARDGTWQGETAIRGSDGRTVPVWQTIAAHRDRAGTLAYYSTILRDLSQLRATETFQHQLLESLAEGVVGIDTEGRYTFLNPAACRMLGFAEEQEALGRESHRLNHHTYPDGSPFPAAACPVHTVQRTSEPLEAWEDRFWRTDGTSFPVVVYAAPLRDTESSLAGAVISFQDISERVAREQALAEREAHYRDLVENHPFLAARFLPDTTITFANRALAAFLDTEPDRLEGTRWVELYDPDERASFERYLAAFTPEAPLQEIESPITAATGETRWVHWTNRAFFDEAGELTHFQGVGIEITEQRQAEQALYKSERRFRQMAEGIDEVFLLRAGDELLYISPACERILGHPPEAFYPSVTNLHAMLFPEDRERLRTSLQEADASGAPNEMIHRIVRPDGELRWLHGHTYNLYDEYDGTPLRAGTLRDITAYKELQHQLEAANRAKSDFLNAVSHDLRTPLNALIGFTDILADSALDAEQRRYLSLCQGAAQRLLGLIDTLLDLARLQSGKVEADPQPTLLRPFLDEQLGLMQAQAAEQGLTLDWHVDPGLPTCVQVDPNRLAQVLFNLVGNAIAYTEAGGVEVAIEPDGPQRGRLSVRDTGPGIPPERQQQIFEPFERGGHEARQAHSGLGLAVAQELARLLGGTIELDSEPGQGSTFTVTLDLPAASTAEAAASGTEAAGTEAADTDAPERPGEGLRVLAAEDDPTNALLIQRLLERAGCTVEVVADGEAALATWARTGPDLVVLDLEMPRMDGYQTVAALREREAAQRAPRTPVAALTAHALEETRQACDTAGFDTYLSKPVGWQAIAALVAWARL